MVYLLHIIQRYKVNMGKCVMMCSIVLWFLSLVWSDADQQPGIGNLFPYRTNILYMVKLMFFNV